MKRIGLLLTITLWLPYLAYANSYLVFINSDDKQQQEQAELLNYLIGEHKILPAEKVYLIDVASKQKAFRGEVQYLYDNDGRYIAKYLPTQLPEVVTVGSGQVIQYSPLSAFLAIYLPPSVQEFP